MLSNSEVSRYERQICLPEFGVPSQERLKAGSVLVVGAGGLGCPVLTYLAAAGVGRIGVVDYDRVSLSNLHRQVLYNLQDIGKAKAEVAQHRLSELNPSVQVERYGDMVTPKNVERLLEPYDVVVDGSDSFSTRYLINDACVVLDKPLVAASIFKFEGQLSVFNALTAAGTRGPTYRCLFSEPPDGALVPPCSEVGVLGVLPGIMGTLQANEVIKLLTGIGQPLTGRLLIFNGLEGGFRCITFLRNESIVQSTRILQSYEINCGIERRPAMNEIAPTELKARQDQGEDIYLIDVREPHEREICHIGGELIPMDTVEDHLSTIPRGKPVVIYCRSGGRSGRVVQYLSSEHGFKNLINLAGGVLRWSDEVDSSVQKY